MKTKKSSKSKSGKKHGDSKNGKLSKKERLAARAAKKAARKGDGSFPNTLFVVKDDDGGFSAFNGDTLDGVFQNSEGAVYKMRRVANVVVHRKIAR